MAATMIELWMDATSDPANPKWVVSRDGNESNVTLGSFGSDDFGDALDFAIGEAKSDEVLFKVDRHGIRKELLF